MINCRVSFRPKDFTDVDLADTRELDRIRIEFQIPSAGDSQEISVYMSREQAFMLAHQIQAALGKMPGTPETSPEVTKK